MLPHNPPAESFKPLLDAFRSSQQIHRLIELNLVVGANFALGWIHKWHPRLNFSSMSVSLPPGRAKLQVHMDATLQPARRIISRLLQEDARFFCEHHYLNPLMVDDSDQPMLEFVCMFLFMKCESFRVLGLFARNLCSQGVYIC
jgi:hypothetical protein